VVVCEPGPQTLDGLFFCCWLYSRNFGNDKHSQLFLAIQSVHRFACFRPLDQLRTAWKNATKHNIHQLAQRAQPILRSEANKAGEYELREMPVQNVRSIFCWKILGCWGSATLPLVVWEQNDEPTKQRVALRKLITVCAVSFAQKQCDCRRWRKMWQGERQNLLSASSKARKVRDSFAARQQESHAAFPNLMRSAKVYWKA